MVKGGDGGAESDVGDQDVNWTSLNIVNFVHWLRNHVLHFCSF